VAVVLVTAPVASSVDATVLRISLVVPLVTTASVVCLRTPPSWPRR
jgi:hypothetical protein